MKNRGFIQLIVILALVLIVISLLGISLGDLFDNETLKKNFSFAWRWTKYIWDNYLYPLVWQPLLKAAEKIKN